MVRSSGQLIAVFMLVLFILFHSRSFDELLVLCPFFGCNNYFRAASEWVGGVEPSVKAAASVVVLDRMGGPR